MPGARTWVKPLSATEPSASDEASLLEIHLQRQLEEDIARIFDESIYSDLEVVCGKFKILTHSCILKARTNEFYHKLQTILHVNIGRGIFDEIYSFVSDAYTECNIRNQEKEILEYLNKTFKVLKVVPNNNYINKEDSEESEVFLTPNCLSPYVDKSCQKSNSSSPSTELTKEYYALVPIDSNILEKELKEQDALSNAFHSIIQTQSEDINKAQTSQWNKPTSLSLSSSHTSKPGTHSNSCDILIKSHFKENIETRRTSNVEKGITISGLNFKSNQVPWRDPVKSGDSESFVDKVVEPVCSPDSLITDDPSSSSDYLSAAYTFSPGASSSACAPQLNVGDITTKMENLFTSSDSGLENTGPLESLSSHKDVALTDLSLTESTLNDLTIDETQFTTSSPVIEGNSNHRVKPAYSNNVISSSSLAEINVKKMNHPSIHKDVGCCKSSKEDKQRQNEEIFIMESSSLSSETGSWESVFPPKLAEREICEKFINKERQYAFSKDVQGFFELSLQTVTFYYKINHGPKKHGSKWNFGPNIDDLCSSLVQKSPYKSTSCFIDAASLADEVDDGINVQAQLKESINILKSDVLPTPSQPVPCSTAKVDLSPNDWSESNDNDDSLEQIDNKDPDSVQKDLSPTIFEMTPITEDSLCVNTYEVAALIAKDSNKKPEIPDSTNHNPDRHTSLSSTVFVTSTPHNSIMSLNACPIKNDENYKIDSSLSGPESLGNSSLKKQKKFNESSPIVSGGASIEDYLPQSGSHSDSPVTRRRIENTPILSGAYIPPTEEVHSRKSPKPSSAYTWVVDMSLSPKVDREKKPIDRVCKSFKNESMGSSISEDINKSPSSINNDSNERSSEKFYIDLSSLPDSQPPKIDNVIENSSEKKNMFSMYIDLGEKLTLKEMPSRLSLNTKKNASVEVKSKSVASKAIKDSADNSVASSSKKCESGSPGTFEKYESLCNDLNISISEIISCPGTKPELDTVGNTGTKDSDSMKDDRPSLISRVDNSSLQHDATILDEPANDQCGDLFVKLSDLDKPVLKSDAPTITTVYEDTVSDVRMTRSIPDNNWDNQSSRMSRPIDVISSFHSENALSLNRLFPHLKNEFSKSMPGSLSSKCRSRASSRRDIDEQPSDVSELSSVQSSMCRSIVENSTTEDTTSQTSSLIVFCQSRLGQDLLRMFLEEITPDVIVEVSGRRIKAHKCILSSRCQYFARILSGGWVESAGNVIVLPPFSFNVVHFALCHIYSGMSTIPDSISIVELATLADMLGLEGLKEAIMFTLKAKYCHHFHKPCAVCTAGVLECFPLSSVYSLDDLYRKCLRWITKHFSKVWPTKAFATLPKELLDKCYQQHIVNLTTDNLVDTVYGCGITVASLQNSRWAECVARMCRRLVVAIAQFAAPRLAGVLGALRAAPPRAPPAATQALHDCLAAAIEWAPPDEAARAYALLSALVVDAAAAASAAAAHRARPDLIADGARPPPPPPASLLAAHAASWRLQCEGALVRAAPRAVHTQAFKELPPELRKRLRELGCIMYGPQVVPAASPLHDRKTRSAYHPKPCKVQGVLATRSLDIDQVRASFVPYAPKPGAHAGTVATLCADLDQRDRRPARMMPPKIRTTKAQEERAKFNMAKTNYQSQDHLRSKAGGTVQTFEKTKPRYLEPRLCKESEKKSSTAKKLMNKMVSSSESSRNSSPVLTRNVRASRVRSRESGAVAGAGAGPGSGHGVRAAALSQDSLASGSRPRTAEPSTDSLSESQNSNKYATYTKKKSATKGSVESIQSTKYQSLHSSSSVNKMKTKIPVYLNQSTKPYQATKHQAQNSNHVDPQRRLHQAHKAAVHPPTEPRARAQVERKLPGSLMNATKSSSAKIVSRTLKEKQTKVAPKPTKGPHKHTSRQEIYEQSVEIPVMQRSGTFLKDEPTFGDITTDIDVDQ